MTRTIILQVLFFVLALSAHAKDLHVGEVSLFSIEGAITPATYDYLSHQLPKVPADGLVIIKMNTPGGLVTTTKDIITLLGKTHRPITIWITPEGASASSAGSIIASAAHFIFMSPGTNMGAATPVGLSEEIKAGDVKAKALNDLTALVRSLSQARHRPNLPFEEMIRKAHSYTDKEALSLKIIDGEARTSTELLAQLQNKKFFLDGEERTLKISSTAISKEYAPTLGQEILEVLANPSTAYFMFLAGIALLYFEFQAPGGYIAGGIGTGLLILAAMAFQVLPLHWGALGLMIAGVVLLVLEAYVTSYGLLAIGGIVSFILGSIFLFHGEAGFISVKYSVLLSTFAGVLFSISIIVLMLYRGRHKGKVSSFFSPQGSAGTVLTELGPFTYQIKVRGEIWKAHSQEKLSLGDKVDVLHINEESLTAEIKKAN